MSGGPLSYEPFFGLKKKPFSLASDPEFLYESPSHSAALLALLAGIRRREGLLAFTGDVGTGKTTICRAVLRNLDRTTFSAFIPDPFASREDLLRMLLIEFGVTSVQDITTGPLAQAGRAQLSYLLSTFLDTLVPLDAFVVVFIDEAQNMSLSLLEEVRVLSDAFNRHGQLQVVFVGQLELLDKLKSPTMRQVDQRVSVYTRLEALSADDVVGYVQHRLQIAGASPNRPMFAPMALSLIHEASDGIPRVINRICDRALQAAYERRSPLIDRALIAEVLDHGPAPCAPATGEVILDEFESEGPSALAVESPAVFATKVDAWLSHLDGSPKRPEAPPPVPEAETSVADDRETDVPVAPVPFEPPLRRRQPERYIHRLARRWARAGVLALVALVGLNAAVAAASYVPTRLTEPVRAQDLPPLPAAPPLRVAPLAPPVEGAAPSRSETGVASLATRPVAAAYSISVGAYTTTERAEKMARALIDSGFPAFTRTLPLRGRVLQQVLVGPYEDGGTAREELARLRQAGDHADAAIVPVRADGSYAP